MRVAVHEAWHEHALLAGDRFGRLVACGNIVTGADRDDDALIDCDRAIADHRAGGIHGDNRLSRDDEVDFIAAIAARATTKTKQYQRQREAMNCFWHAVFCHK